MSCHLNRVLLLFLLSLSILSGCMSLHPDKRVQVGDRLQVDYTCRLEDGRLVATTRELQSLTPGGPQETLFHPPENYESLTLIAKDPQGADSIGAAASNRVVPLEEEIKHQLAYKLTGLPMASQQHLRLSSSTIDDLVWGSRYLRLSRVRRRPKEHRISLTNYREQSDDAPQIGQQIECEPGFRRTIRAITENYIVCQLEIEKGEAYQSIFGSGEIVDAGSHFEIIMDVKEGQLVRDRERLGVISSVDGRYFIVDYGHPFGGQSLSCDVNIQSYEQERADR